MALKRGFKAESNRIAIRVREKMGLLEYEPIDPYAICKEFDIVLKKLSDVVPDSKFLGLYSDSFSAVTVPCGIATAIVHNDKHHPHRQRSNICHELAHCFLGHEGAPPLMDDGKRSRNKAQEEEAHFLSGALLISNEAANWIMKTGTYQTAQKDYGVSQVMLDFRLRVSGAQKIFERRLRLAQ